MTVNDVEIAESVDVEPTEEQDAARVAKLRDHRTGIDAERAVYQGEVETLGGEIAAAIEAGSDRAALYQRQRVIGDRFNQATVELGWLDEQIGQIEARQGRREAERRAAEAAARAAERHEQAERAVAEALDAYETATVEAVYAVRSAGEMLMIARGKLDAAAEEADQARAGVGVPAVDRIEALGQALRGDQSSGGRRLTLFLASGRNVADTTAMLAEAIANQWAI
jgi:chromosome segregation ATPase